MSSCKIAVSREFSTYDDVVDHDEAGNNERLTDFNTINTSVDIDSIRAEDRQVAHVHVVKNGYFEGLAQNSLEKRRNDY